MANITVFEFAAPSACNEPIWPANVVTTTTTASAVTLSATTRTFIVCADADCRMRINANGVTTAAGASTLPILSAIANQFTVPPAGQTLKFA